MVTLRELAPIAAIAAFATLLAAPANAADVFKWVDGNGVTHYSDTAPEGQKVQKMPPGLPNLTVIPSVKFVAPPATASRIVEQRPMTPRIVERSAKFSEAEQLAAWRTQCVQERWADCDDRRALYARYGTMADGFGGRGYHPVH
jgi:Domain of unknown function (DUF4124)